MALGLVFLLMGWVALGFGFPNPFLFLFPSLLTQTNLNSNKFEFKTLFTQTNKIMHQHECNNKIKPMINFNYLRIKIRLNESLITINLRILNKAH